MGNCINLMRSPVKSNYNNDERDVETTYKKITVKSYLRTGEMTTNLYLNDVID